MRLTKLIKVKNVAVSTEKIARFSFGNVKNSRFFFKIRKQLERLSVKGGVMRRQE